MTLENAFEGLAVESKQDTANTTLSSLLTELGQKLEPADLAALATAAKQDTAKAVLDTISATLTAIDGHVDGLEGKDYATQTTLAAILAKIIAAPATEATLASVLAAVDGLETNTTGLATQTTAAAILAKLIAAPSTEAKQDALAALVGEVQASPTANTLLARVKTLEGYLDGVETLLGALTSGSQITGLAPRTAGGTSIFRSIDLDETEEEVKTSAGQLYGWFIYNAGAATVYVKLYNATAANVTVGTTTPVMTIPIPAGAAANVEFTNGIAFSTAITAAATTGVADNDTGAPAANQVVANLMYA